MSASTAQLQFAAEFVLFLAAVSGVAAVALARGGGASWPAGRGRTGTPAFGTPWPAGEDARIPAASRSLLGAGFVSLATAAFLHGTQLIAAGSAPVVVVLRLAGVAGVVVGSLRWPGGTAARRLIWVAMGLVALAVVADLVGAGRAAGAVLAAGAVALGAAVVSASRRSIAARVAASAALTLLIVVLLLAVALSAVLVETVEDGAAERLERRLDNEAATAARSYTARLGDAKLVGGTLQGLRPLLERLADARAPSPELSDELEVLSRNFLADVALAYVSRSGTVHGVVNLDSATVVALADSEVVQQAVRRNQLVGSVEVVSGKALAIGVQPVQPPGAARPLGAAAAVSELDDTYLATVSRDDPNLSLALVTRAGVVARRGPQPPLDSIAGMVAAAIDEGRGTSSITAGRFVSVAPVESADGRPVLAMVASSPTTLVRETRDSLFRNLFLIALGGTLLALLLASLVGARIGAGLRRLTEAAEGIQRGDFGVRAHIESDDEVGVLGNTFDSMAASVQEKTATEARLRGRLEAVVAGMGEALVAVDAAGVVTDFNRAAEELFGVREDRVRGRPLREVLSLTDQDGSSLDHQLHTAARWSAEAVAARPGGGDGVPVAVSVGPLQAPGGEVGGTVIVLRDLRREREVEQMKTEFLSRIGHELRTPLTPIKGYASFLARKGDRQAQQWGQEILTQSDNLLRMVEMLEFFATAGAGRVSVTPERVEVKALVDDVVTRWTERVDGKREIATRVRRGTPPVLADRRLLGWCLDELVDNAVKFSPNGGRIVVAAGPAGGGGVQLSVIDHGKGMTDEERENAFAVFTQGDPSDTRSYGGLGLGLAFVQRVVDSHNGSLRCETGPGKGTKLSIFLPGVPIRRAE